MPKSNKNLKNKAKKKTKLALGRKVIYLDYAASALPNPSSIHALGVEAKRRLENARKEIAALLGARSEEVLFTSGGTESNNLAIAGMVFAHSDKGFLPHVVTTNIEHPSVLETCRLLEKRGLAEITIVPVEANGIVDPKKIRKELKENTVLVSVMYANNEIGTIQPIREIAREIRHFRKYPGKENPSQGWEGFSFPIFHTDAVQAVHLLDLNVEKLGVDLLTLSGSKIENSERVGLLFKKRSVPLAPLFGGGDQELGLRPGTENLEAIIKFARAFQVVRKIKDTEVKRLKKLQAYFFDSLIRANKSIVINGDRSERLPNNISITFPKIPSDLLVIELSERGVMCSSKSACKSSKSEGSYVVEAIRPGADSEIGGVRFSMGKNTTKNDIKQTIQALTQILQKLKKWYY